jgi:hypothetical protein
VACELINDGLHVADPMLRLAARAAPAGSSSSWTPSRRPEPATGITGWGVSGSGVRDVAVTLVGGSSLAGSR